MTVLLDDVRRVGTTIGAQVSHSQIRHNRLAVLALRAEGKRANNRSMGHIVREISASGVMTTRDHTYHGRLRTGYSVHRRYF